MTEKIISQKEYEDLLAKLLVEGLNDEERKQVDTYQKALVSGKAKKTSTSDERKMAYRNELKRQRGQDYDKKNLGLESVKNKFKKLKEGLTPAFQKELFRLLRNHYPNATTGDMEKVSKFIDRICQK
jgi:membrane peptidoglycan carboxypeptidase